MASVNNVIAPAMLGYDASDPYDVDATLLALDGTDNKSELGANTQLGSTAANLLSSAVVSPIYVAVTNPLSRLEVIMQTSAIGGKRIGVLDAMREFSRDSKQFGLRGIFRGQGVGIFKAVISLSLFHEG